jgi:hypothetical protein
LLLTLDVTYSTKRSPSDVLQRDEKGGRVERRRTSSRKPQGTLREPTQQHRPTQSTAQAEKAALEQTPTFLQ